MLLLSLIIKDGSDDFVNRIDHFNLKRLCNYLSFVQQKSIQPDVILTGEIEHSVGKIYILHFIIDVKHLNNKLANEVCDEDINLQLCNYYKEDDYEKNLKYFEDYFLKNKFYEFSYSDFLFHLNKKQTEEI